MKMSRLPTIRLTMRATVKIKMVIFYARVMRRPYPLVRCALIAFKGMRYGQ